MTDACEVFGYNDKAEYTTVSYGDSTGVKIVYSGGDPCLDSENPSQKNFPKQATFHIVCSAHQDSNFILKDSNSKTITKCSPEFMIHSPAGCIGGHYHGKWGFFTWAFIIIFVYFVIGTFLNMKNNNMRGTDAIPHYDTLK